MSFKLFVEFGVSYFIRNEDFIAKHPQGWHLLACLCILALCAGAAGYFIGCFNPAIVFSRKLYGCDVRSHGSGNAGMTNMFRVFGKKAGFLTLAGDVGKTVVATVCGYAFLGYIGAWIAGLFCMIGHMFPFCFGFKGGKGVLVAAVVLLMTDWPVFLTSILVFAIVLLGTRMVSMASVMAAITMPLFLNIVYKMFYSSGSAAGLRFPIAVVMAVLIAVAHRQNLKRIRAKEEPKIRFPWEKKAAEEPETEEESPKTKKKASGSKKSKKGKK